jgi:hypothetical protein
MACSGGISIISILLTYLLTNKCSQIRSTDYVLGVAQVPLCNSPFYVHSRLPCHKHICHFWPTRPCRADTQLIPTQHIHVGDGGHLPLSSFCTRVRMHNLPKTSRYSTYVVLLERPHPQSAGTTKSQRRVGTRKRPQKKTITSDREITCVLERN